jgi:DNA-binding CsgD family transcriptional regulator
MIHHLKPFFLFVAFLLINTFITVPINAQISILGVPEIYHFEKREYNGGTQTWDITSVMQNVILAANNEGLLIYDGQRWQKYDLPNKTILRSLAYDAQTKRIYVGGQDELGYFYPDENGILHFYDLKPSIPTSYNTLEDVWDLKVSHNTLYFRSLNKIFILSNGKWNVIYSSDPPFLANDNDKIIFNDVSKGLFEIVDGKPLFIQGSGLLQNRVLTDAIFLHDQWFVFSEKDGYYLYKDKKWSNPDTKENQYLKENRVHSVCKINDTLMAVGTYLKGIILINHNGQAQKIITKEDGLQNNTIASLYYSPNHQLWAGTYNGIDMVDLGGKFTTIFPDGLLAGTVYASEIWQGNVYLGTENGLYYIDIKNLKSPFKKNAFTLVPGSEGQVWGLDTIMGDLIMSHNDGAFVIKQQKAVKISSIKGAWKFVELHDKNYCVGGFYTGIYLFTKKTGLWVQVGKIKGFDESSRIIIKDDTHLWVSHPYRGLFRISIDLMHLTSGVEKYGIEQGLPGNFRNNAFNINNDLIVAAEKGLYKFDKNKNKFVSFNLNPNLQSNLMTYKTLAYKNGLIWFATDEESGFVHQQSTGKTENNHLVKFETKKILVPGFEKIYPLQNGDAIFLTTKGIKYFQHKSLINKNISAYISGVYDINNKKTISQGFRADTVSDKKLTFNYKSNAFSFDFAATTCNPSVKFRWMLSPSQKEWSNWEDKNNKEFNNLSPGNYEMLLQVKDDTEQISNTYIYHFEITPPWYKSIWALLSYILLILTSIWYSRHRLVNKYEKITSHLEEQKNEQEAMVLQLQNEKLEADILFKNKELGITTMHLVQKNETFNKLRNELGKITKMTAEPVIKKEINNLISILSDDERLEEDWSSFAQNFDAIHNNFLQKIKSQYPGLSPRDLKLCAYLKLNLTTKDIAPLLNISVRGVEISRYRLRKKMDLPNDTNLNDFMMSYQ